MPQVIQKHISLLVLAGFLAAIDVQAVGLSRGFTSTSDFRWFEQLDTNSVLRAIQQPMAKPVSKPKKQITEKPAPPETKRAKVDVTKRAVDPRKVNAITVSDKKTELKKKDLPNLTTSYEPSDSARPDRDTSIKKIDDTRRVFIQRVPPPKNHRHPIADWP